MQYDGSIRINTNINPKDISNYEINQEGIKRLRESIARIEKIMNDYYNPQRLKQSMETLNMILEDRLGKLLSSFNQYNYSDMLKGIRYSIAEMAEAINIKQMEVLQNIDFSRLFRDSFYREKYEEASSMAFDYVEEEVESEEYISQEELLETFNKQMEDEIGWQEKWYNKSEDFKRKYFVFYKVFIGLLWFIIGQIAIYFTQLGIAYALGNLTLEPEKDSPVIYYFDQRTEVNIIGETDKYYFIIYTDSDGNEVMGYSDKEDMEIVSEDNTEITGDIE